MNTETNDRPAASVATGTALILAGAFLTLNTLGYLQWFDVGRGWPLFIIVLALLRIGASIKEPRQHGWSLLMIGDWLFANTMTDWVYVQFSVPVLVVGFGLFIFAHAFIDRSQNPGGMQHVLH